MDDRNGGSRMKWEWVEERRMDDGAAIWLMEVR